MKLPKYTIRTILFLLYIAAVVVRFVSAERSDYLYFNDISATNYRYAHMISENSSIPELDLKASWPEGTSVAKVRPMGMEYFTGYAYRLVKYFSEIEKRPFTRHLTILFLSLLVFTVYALSHILWRYQAGALFTAFLVAFFDPLVEASNGGVFLHLHYAAVVLSFHLFLVVRTRERFSPAGSILIALSSFALLAVWEASSYYLALFALSCVVWPGVSPEKKRCLLTLNAAVFIFAALLLPHLSAQRFLFSLPASCIYSSALLSYLTAKLPSRTRSSLWSGLYVLLGTLIITILLKPFHSGGLTPYPAIQYFLYRLRYIVGRPENPIVLPDAVRYVWTHGHAPPSSFEVFRTILPFTLFVPPLIAAALASRKEDKKPHLPSSSGGMESASTPSSLLASSVIALISVVLYLSDRSLLALAVIGTFPLLAYSCRTQRKHFLAGGLFLFIGALLIILQTCSPRGSLDAPYRIARRMGLQAGNISDFLRTSSDRNLIRFTLTRTSVRDPFLCLPGMSSLLCTFGGRTTLLIPGVESEEMIGKTVSLLAGYYGNEVDFYRACRINGIEYVLYSIDLVLDGSEYSPRYLAGEDRLTAASTAYKMQFFPETLKNFSLIYENDLYRLFEVTDEIKPFFITDHPPIYQYEILEKNNDSLTRFYERVMDLLLLYGGALEEQAKGNDSGALDLFNICLRNAPHFTLARLGQAASFEKTGDLEAAKEAYLTVIGYAPDNPRALYGAAFVLARLGDTKQAEGFIDILLTSTSEEEVIRKAKLLQWFIDEGIPIDKPDKTEPALPDANSTGILER